MKFALIATIAAASAITLRTPGEPFYKTFAGEKNCSDEDGSVQRVYEAGKPGVISRVATGASCINNIGDASLV